MPTVSTRDQASLPALLLSRQTNSAGDWREAVKLLWHLPFVDPMTWPSVQWFAAGASEVPCRKRAFGHRDSDFALSQDLIRSIL